MAANQTSNQNQPITIVRPDPDPTVRTTEQLLRELENLKEQLEVRFSAYDKAVDLLQTKADKSPSIAEVVAKMDEKFNSVQTQFTERDVRTDQTSRDSKGAVDAALTAAKELNAQQSAAITEKIDKSEVSFSNQIKTLDDKIDALTIRTTGSESRGVGKTDAWVWIAIVAFISVTVLAFIFKGGA